MADPVVTPPVVTPPAVTPPAVTPPAVTPGAPWYEGKADAETVGFWQNKGWNIADPAVVALEASRAYAAVGKHLGAPPDEMVRFPKNPMDPAYDAIRQRLGVPATAADYDLTAVKFADGSTLDPVAEQTFREAAHAAGVPKDRIGSLLTPIIKFMEGQETQEAADRAAAVTAERALLAKNWGANDAINRFNAQQGAAKLGFTAEHIAALEQVGGYATVMEAMRRVGVSEMEDASPGGGTTGGNAGKIVTLEQAQARKAELMRDKAWADRFLKGGAQEHRDMTALNTIIAAAATNMGR